ncbi:MAG: RDD family protein [bacterium]|nr:RDD family protein [bacterium]
MGKRKRSRGSELPLFDLPLQSESTEDGLGAEQVAATPAPTSIFARQASSGKSGDPEPEAAAPAKGDAEVSDAVLGGDTVLRGDAAARGDTVIPADAALSNDRVLLGDRLLASLADLTVQLVMLALAVAACHTLGIAVSLADWKPFALLATVFSFLYWVVPLAFWGQTPGMAWVGHVARTSEGEPLTFGQTFRRWLGAVVTLALGGLPLLLALTTNRSFTDRLSNSETLAG